MYRAALATARNVICHNYGGVSNRPGLRYLGPVKNHTYAPRFIPFKFKSTDTYLLEPGDSLTFPGEVAHGPEKLVKFPIKFLSFIVYPRSAE